MTSNEGASITEWLGNLQRRRQGGEQPLWERHLSKLVDRRAHQIAADAANDRR